MRPPFQECSKLLPGLKKWEYDKFRQVDIERALQAQPKSNSYANARPILINAPIFGQFHFRPFASSFPPNLKARLNAHQTQALFVLD
jgi:hypothetical protein